MTDSLPTLYNPLDKFSSYSIHHVLLACRTTVDAQDFTDASKNGDTIAAINEVKQLGDAVPYGKKDTAYLVMDTRRFTQFSVESMKYEVLINGLDKVGGSPANLATTMNMVIMDSVGISFVNFLQWLMDEKMQTNFDGMIFMHRLLFIGRNTDGSTELVQSVTIPLMLFKLELNLDYARGAYTIEWQPNINFDVTKHLRWLNISSATTYFSGKDGAAGNNLGAMIRSFEERLNNKSAEYFTKVQKAMKDAGRVANGRKNYGRQVRYLITLPDGWNEMTFTGPSTGSATERIFAKLTAEEKAVKDKAKAAHDKQIAEAKKSGAVLKPGEANDSYLSVEIGSTVTHVLDVILSQVNGVAQLAAGVNVKGENGSVTFYKHHVGITSDDDVVIVHIDVVPFMVPNIVIDKKKGAAVVRGEDEFYQPLQDGRRIPKNFAAFDYIFTGKNKDILNLDLKIQDLQFLLSHNLNLGGAAVGLQDNVKEKSTEAKPPDKSAMLVNTRAYDAILLPRNTKDELDNFSRYTALKSKDTSIIDIGVAQDQMNNLSRFYAMSPITVHMTIRGNPDIMAKFNQSSFMPHQILGTANAEGKVSLPSITDRDNYRKAFEAAIIKNNTHTDAKNVTVEEFKNVNGTFVVAKTLGNSSYARSPVFVQINIKGPNVDFRTGLQKPDLLDGSFGQTLLKDNFFVVFKVTNIIEGQSFKQELELYSHNIFGAGKISIAAPQTK